MTSAVAGGRLQCTVGHTPSLMVQISPSQSPNYPSLLAAVSTCRAVDNHAHPLLKASERRPASLLELVTEARGGAMAAAPYTLAARRASHQLASLYGAPNAVSESTDVEKHWEALASARDKLEYDDLCRRCIKDSEIACLLLDDGLTGVTTLCESLSWHDQFASAPTRRIVRVEVVAEDIFRELIQDQLQKGAVNASTMLSSFSSKLLDSLRNVASDHDVVGFKSIVCYRTGLSVSLRDDFDALEKALTALMDDHLDRDEDAKIRLQYKPLNDLVVRIAMQVSSETSKPIQFHTGLGDNDLQIALASPALLQPLITAYPLTPVVLLHGAYPFTREAGYLANTYENVYLDFGEIFGPVSAAGQRAVISQMLELCPTNKALWSSDGHWWPETFYFGSIQGREAMYEVLSDAITRKEITEPEAVAIVKQMLFENANRLYKLALEA